MVAIIGGGAALGLTQSSGATLGRTGILGDASTGRTGQQTYVNSATGNLVIQSRDELVKANGLDVELLRTYNSQGLLDDDNGDNWRLSAHKKLTIAGGLFGTTVTKTAGDGAQAVYNFGFGQTSAVTTEGGGAHDTLAQTGGQWVWTDGSTREVEIYDGNGRLIEARDPDGRAVRYAYTGALLSTITDASGQITYLDYTGNNLSRVRVVSSGQTQTLVRYAYDASNRLSTVTVDLSPADNIVTDGRTFVTNYTYDGTSRRVASITQTDGTAVAFTYQLLLSGKWVVKTQIVTDTVGTRTTTFNYTEGFFGMQCDVVDPLGLTTTYIHDGSGQLTSVRSPDTGNGRVQTDYVYDSAGNVLSTAVDPAVRNMITTHEYDDRGNPVLTYDAMGNTVSRVFSATNQLLAETKYLGPDPDGGGFFGMFFGPSKPVTTRYIYDASNHLRFVVSADGQVTENRYVSGNRASARRFTGAVYNVSALAPAATLSESQLSAWVALQDQTKLELVDYAYDFRGQLTRMTAWAATTSAGVGSGTSSVTSYIYDQRGNLIQKVDPRGSATTTDLTDYVTTYVYDGFGRLTQSTEWVAAGLTRVTQNQYDDVGNRVISTFANGLVTTSTYSRAGALTSVVNTGPAAANLGATGYKYDANGRLRIVTDPTGVRQFYFYDNAGRKTAEVDGDGSLTEFIYDKSNRVIKTVRYAALLSQATLASLVDAGGNPTNVGLATLRTAAGGNPSQDRITRNVYNQMGQLVYAIDEVGAVTETFYDGANRVTDVVRYANTASIDRAMDELVPINLWFLFSASPSEDRRTRFFYDNDGRTVGELDAAGYLTEHTYNGAGKRIKTVAYARATPEVARLTGTLADLRPAVDEETTITPERDIVNHYFHDGQGREVGHLDGEGYLTETVFDVDGNKIQVIRYDSVRTYTPSATLATLRPTGVPTRTSSFSYDGLGRLARETNHEGTVNSFTYDAADRVVSTTRALGAAEVRTVQARYDALGRLTQELTAEGVNRLVAGQTPAQIEAVWAQYGVRHNYDLAGRRVSSIDQMGARTIYFYDADGRLRFVINARGEVSEKRYNAFGQLTAELGFANRLPLATLATLTGGLLTSTIEAQVRPAADAARDMTSSFTYTLTGQVATRTTREGGSITSLYNSFGDEKSHQTSIDALRSRRTVFNYDKRGQLTSTRNDADGLNLTESREYDAFGRLTRVTDARNGISRMEYDRMGRTVATVDALLGRRVTTYDAFSRVLTQRDALGNMTQYAYSDASRSVVMTTPEGLVITTVRNRHGEDLSVTSAGNTTLFTYDLNGRLTGASDNLGTLESRTYDAAGRQLSEVDGRGTTTSLSYDASGRVLTRSVNSGSMTLTTVYAYDGMGRVIRVTEPNGRITDTDYDRDGRVRLVTVDATGLNLRTGYTYDREGRTLTVTQGEGSATPRASEYRYDALGRRAEEIVDPAGLALTTRYRYDANGNMTRRIDANGQSFWYVFDANNQQRYAINALGEVTETTYDAEGRVTGTRGYMTRIATGSFGDVVTAVTVATNVADRVERTVYDRDGRAVYGIDGAGTVTQRTFDAAGRVTRTRSYALPVPLSAYATPSAVATALGVAGNNVATLSSADRVNWTVFDVRGRSTFTIDGIGAVVAFQYDANGNVIGRTAYATLRSTAAAVDQASLLAWASANAAVPANQVTRFWYDNLDRQRFVLDAEGALRETRYDEAIRAQTDIVYAAKPAVPAGATLAMLQSAIVLTAGRDQIVTTVSDKAGRVTQQTDGEGFVTRFVFDAVGNKTETQRALDVAGTQWAVERIYYDRANRQSSSLSPEGYLTVLSRDGIGSVTSRTEYEQRVIAPASGAPSPVLGDAGRRTSFTYDNAGRMLTETNPLSITTRYQYDAHGSRLDMVEAFGTAEARTTTYVHDAADRLTQFTNAAGTVDAKTTRLELDAFGNVVTRRDAFGTAGERVSRTAFDAANREVSTTDALGVVTTTAMDALGNVTTRTAAAGTADARVETLSYDRNNRLTRRVDALGNVTVSYTYDTAGNVATSLNPNANPLLSSNDAYYVDFRKRLGIVGTNGAGKAVSALTTADRDALTRACTTQYQYDRNNRLARETDALGVVTTYAYDGTGRRTAMVEASGLAGQQRTTQYAYDKDGRLTSQTDAMGGITRYTYDMLGMALTVTDANGAVVTNTYDAVGRLLATVRSMAGAPGGGIRTVNTYDRRGNVLSSTLSYVNGSDARVTTYVYDRMDRQVRITNGEGFSTNIVYDRFGNQTSVTNGLYLLTSGQAGYDAAKAARAVSMVNTFAFDSGDRMTSMTDGVGNVTAYAYDRVGNRTSTTEASNGLANTAARTTTYVYDKANRLKSIFTPAGGQTHYTYDAAGNKILEAKLQSGEWAPEFPTEVWINNNYEYDTENQLTAEIDPYNTRTQLYYDAVGNLTERRLAAGTTDQRRVRMTYDLNNRLTSDIDAMGGVTSYAYDKVGNRIKVTNALGQTARYYFDEASRLTMVADPERYFSTFQYDAAGNRTQERVHMTRSPSVIVDGTVPTPALSANDRIVTQTYDRASQLLTRTEGENSRTDFVYDGSGKKIRETAFATAPLPRVMTYAYDQAGRMTRFTDADGTVTDFTYDGANNRLTEKLTNASDPIRERLTVYTYDLNNRRITETFDPTGLNIIRVTGYDYLGNVVIKGVNSPIEYSNDFVASPILHGETFEYDLNNRLVSQTIGAVFENDPPAIAVKLTTSYTYDKVGNRVSMTSPNGNATGADPVPHTTNYAYDLNNRLTREIKPAVEVFTWDGDRGIGTTSTTRPTVTTVYDAVGNIVQVIDPNGNKSTNYYDGNGRVVRQLNADNVLGSYDFDGAGNLVQSTLYMVKLNPTAQNPGVIAQPVSTDPKDVRVTNHEYDRANRLTRTILPQIAVTTLASTGGNSPTSIKTDVRLTEVRRYDAYGNEVELIDRAGNRTLSYFDVKGRKVATVDAMGYMVEWDYDSQDNKLAERVFMQALASPGLLSPSTRPARPGGTVLETNKTYDAASRLIRVVSPSVASYDPETRVTTQVRPTTTYAYDRAGNMLTKTTGAGTPQAVTEAYFYDAAYRRVTVIDSNRVVNWFRYDSNGNVMVQARAYGQLPQAFNDSYLDLASTDLIVRHNIKLAADFVITNELEFDGVRYDLQQYKVFLYDGANRMSGEFAAGDAATGDERIKQYKYDASGNRTYMTEGPQTGLLITRTQYDGLNRVRMTTTADGNGTKFEYDAAGNPLTLFTGVTSSGTATPATNVRPTLSSSVIDASVSTQVTLNWDVPGNQRTWVVYDTVSRNDIASYLNQTSKRVGVNGKSSASVPAPASGTRLYFRVITQDSAGNIAWTPEQSLNMPPRVTSVVVGRPNATSLTVTARFDATVTSPVLTYGAPGALTSNAAFVLQADGSYRATLSNVADPNALAYALRWSDGTSNVYATAEARFVTPSDRLFTSTALESYPVQSGGTTKFKMYGYTMLSAAQAAQYQFLQVQWRPANSTVGYTFDDTTKQAVGNGFLYGIDAGADNPLNAGVYEVIVTGVKPDGTVITLSAFSMTLGMGAPDQGSSVLNWNVPNGISSSQFAIVGGQVVESRRVNGRLLTSMPQTGLVFPIDYLVNYTDPVATAHSVLVTSSSTTGTSNLTVRATLNAAEVANVGTGGLRVAWKAASATSAFTSSQTMPVTATAGVYQSSIASLAAGQYDLKVYYIDKQGNEVIVEWRRANTASASAIFSGNSQTVIGMESGSLTSTANGLTIVPGAYRGKVDLTNLGSAQQITASLTGPTGGSATFDGRSTGYVVTSGYDALNNKIAGLDDEGLYREYGVDAYGNTVETRLYGEQNGPVGQQAGRAITTYSAYDARSRKVANFMAPMQVTGTSFLQRPVERYTYDALDNMLNKVEANGRTTTYTYNAMSKLLTQASADTGTITYRYDQFQRQTSQVDGRGAESRKVYDLPGRMTKEINELGRTTAYEYDYFNRLVAKTTARGVATTTVGDYTTQFVYNGHDDLTQVIRASDGSFTVSYAYDERGNRIRTTRDVAVGSAVNIRTEEDDFDAMGRVTEHRLKSGTTTHRSRAQYDAYGNVIAEFDEMGRVVNSVYQGYGRIEQEIDQDGVAIAYQYDDFGRVIREYNPDSAAGKNVRKTYDDAGRVLTIVDSATGVSTTYTYDIQGGRATELVTRNGTAVRNVRYTRDLQGRMTRWDDSVTGASELIEYDLNGNRTRVSTKPGWAPTGSSTGVNNRFVDHVFAYDAANNLTGEWTRTTNTLGTVTDVKTATYTYDVDGNRASWDDIPNRTLWTYAVDVHGRVTSATGVKRRPDNTVESTTVRRWTYDTVGNVLTYTEHLTNATVTNDLIKSVTSTYNLADVAEIVDTTEKKDGTGPLATTRNQTYYDASQRAERMVVTTPDGSFEYKYEHYGDGREKSVSGVGGRAKGSSTSFYDANKIRTKVDRGLGDGMETADISTFTSDNEGHLLSSTDNLNTNATSDDVTTQYLYAESQPVGTLTRKNGQDELVLDAGDYRLFDTPDENHPGGVSSYTTREGDSLQAIASMVYGNPSLWFVLADANGINGAEPLRAGITLKVPNTIRAGTITADNHVVYSEGDVVGSTLPNLKTPPPKKKSKCGAIVAIIATVIVAVVVSVVTFGVAAPAAAAASAAVVGAVGATLAVGVGLVAAAAIGAAIAVAGSFLRQGILMLAGLQEKFSWKDLGADAAVGAFSGAAAGVGGIASAAAKAGTLSTLGSLSAKVASAALQASGSAVSQKIRDGKITNFTGIATAAIGGLVSANSAIGKVPGSGIDASFSKVVDVVGTVSRYASPWVGLAETYVRNDHKLGTKDWLDAVSGTAMAATDQLIDKYTNFNTKTTSGRFADVGLRLASGSALAGVSAIANRRAGREYFTNAVGEAIGSVIDGELLRGGFAKLKEDADDAYIKSRKQEQSAQVSQAATGAGGVDKSTPLSAKALGVSLGEPGEFDLKLDESLFDMSSFMDGPQDKVIQIKKGDSLQKLTGIRDPHVLDQIAQYNGWPSRHEIPANATAIVPIDLSSVMVSDGVAQRGKALAKEFAQKQDARAKAKELAAEAYQYDGLDDGPSLMYELEGGMAPNEVQMLQQTGDSGRQPVTVGSLAKNFAQGAADVVWQPAATIIDLGQMIGAMGYGLATGDYFEPEWLSDTGRRASAGASVGELLVPELLAQTRVGGITMATAGVVSAVDAGDWNQVARLGGTLLTGAFLGVRMKRGVKENLYTGKGLGDIIDAPMAPQGAQTKTIRMGNNEAVYTVDIDTGLPLHVDGKITGPHPLRIKGSLPEPVGGRQAGDHRGHMIPENAVDNPKLVNVPHNLNSEAPSSNLGLKKVVDNRASQLAGQNRGKDVRFIAEPVRVPGQSRPKGVTQYVVVDGEVQMAVTVLNW